jgi:hypothetical protein
MSNPEDQLEQDRALRDEARELFIGGLAQLRQDMTPRAIGERIADRVGAKADSASDAAFDLVETHGRTAAAALAVAASAGVLWLARKPILAGVSRLTGRRLADNNDGGVEGDEDNEHE